MEISLVLIILAAIFGAILITASVVQSIVFIQLLKCRAKNVNNLTGQQVADLLLNKLGMPDIQVKKSNWFVGFFYGDYYSSKKKTIYLKGRLYENATIASVGVATQKVALALQDKNGDKNFKTKSKFQPYVFSAPLLFIPVSLIGIVIDLVLSKSFGYISLALIAIAFLGLIVSFILLLISLPAERKANSMALEIIEQTNLLNEKETVKVKKLFKINILLYVAGYILTTVYIVGLFFKIFGKLVKRK